MNVTVEKLLDDIERRAKRCGVTPAYLCERGGIHQKTWRRWRAGTSKPTFGTVERITAALESIERRRTI